ncbi:MAG: pyridoxal phosphate-dependent aminotransferase, partial [Streptomyces sp.]|nr:pyridoxal phosphate-dependent aminotransferase [Streptomyces sp.]
PADVARRLADGIALHARVATAVHRVVVTAGALARPPQAGRHLYADLGPLRSALDGHGVGDAQELEDFLSARLDMPAPGGHRFGDDLAALRVRLATAPLLGTTPEERAQCLASPTPLELPHVQGALTLLESVFDDLGDEAQRRESPR